MKRQLLIQLVLALVPAQVLSDLEPRSAMRAEPAPRSSRPSSASNGVADEDPGPIKHRCCTCDELKDASAFSASWLRRKSKVCRDCKAGFNRRWYDENKQKHIKDVLRNNARYRRRNGALLLELKSQPCLDCGATLHPMAMDFDHVRGVKEWDISDLSMRTPSVKRLLDEVAKCDLVCANCHRIRTAHRLQASGKRVYWASEEGMAEEPSR